MGYRHNSKVIINVPKAKKRKIIWKHFHKTDIYNRKFQSNHFCYFKIPHKENKEEKLFLKNT